MNKRLLMLIGGFTLPLLIFFAIVVRDFIIDEQMKSSDPRHFGRYIDSGYYEIDSETILASLDEGNKNVFAPLVEDPNLIESLSDISFSWTQLDFLNIASALGQLEWDDPMDLRNWKVYYISFEKSCQDDLYGYQFGSVTYFRTVEINEKEMYATRLVEIDPFYNWVRWGDGATYPKPLLKKWESIILNASKFTAEDALRIAEKNGGRDARLRVENECFIYVNSYNNNKWEIDYIGTDFHIYVDLSTGEYEIQDANQ